MAQRVQVEYLGSPALTPLPISGGGMQVEAGLMERLVTLAFSFVACFLTVEWCRGAFGGSQIWGWMCELFSPWVCWSMNGKGFTSRMWAIIVSALCAAIAFCIQFGDFD